MSNLIWILCFFSLTLSSLASSADKVDVKVIDNIPTESSYTWQVSGYASASCYGHSCSAYYSPASNSTRQVSGAVLKLLIPDGRIVIVECTAKYDVAANILVGVMTGLGGPAASTVFRDCRAPSDLYKIQAVLGGNRVKLFMTSPALYGKVSTTSETYAVRGVLAPGIASGDANKGNVLSGFDPQCTGGNESYKTAQACYSMKRARGYLSGLNKNEGSSNDAERKALPYLQRAARLGNIVAQNYLKQEAGMPDEVPLAAEAAKIDPMHVQTPTASLMYAFSPQLIDSNGTNNTRTPRAQLISDVAPPPSHNAAPNSLPTTHFIVLTTPAQAKVRVDGAYVGASPVVVVLAGVSGEEHTITIEKAGWDTVVKAISADGTNERMDLTLVPAKSTK